MPFRLCRQTLFAFAAAVALSLPAAAQQADVRLPSLGSSADTVMSPQEADAYGAEFLRELRAAHLVLDDPQVDQYLHTLGYRLASVSADPSQHYTFTLINVPEINSFATFGGYIFIFSGMFTITQNQDQLAAVMAHELAHISQHHLQRAIEDQKKSTPLYVLGAFAAALAASRTDSDRNNNYQNQPYGYGYGNTPYSQGVDPAIGAFYSVMAMMEQHMIDFTRKDEEEADHVGIETLAKAGFDPEAMATVFAHMQELLRPGGDGGMAAGNIPDFLQDHPVTSVRIADARARAHVLEQQMHAVKACVSVQSDASQCKEQPMDALDSGTTGPSGYGMLPLPFVKDSSALLDHSARGPSEQQYELMRERVRVLSSSDPRSVLDYYTRNMSGNAKFAASASNRYGYALALLQLNQASKAVPIMQKLAAARPDDLTLALGLAYAERHAGQRNEALQRYAALNTTWPNDPAIVLDYSQALLDSGTKADAKTAQGLLKPLLNDDSEPSLYATYGHACHVAGDEVHAGIAYADATFLSGHAADALDQLHRLLDRKDLDYYTRAQIDSRIAQITPIVLEIRRRHLDQDQNGGDSNSLQGSSSPARQTGLRFGVCAGASCSQP
ncbi:MAG TPA: M48 family metalloprotease [Rhodanobacteraceae bacterium]|jgi:predicted Zn-dependent protease|nr:M48 family metalloprotease [Rhodanobacteraceae bacterium]